MKDDLRNIEYFFEIDLEIKKIIHQLAFNKNISSNDYLVKYSDDLCSNLEIIQYYFISLAYRFNFGTFVINSINELFCNYKENLISCGCYYDKLNDFYKKYISNMNVELVDKINDTCIAYTDRYGLNLISDIKTINELLHLFHSYIVNNEWYYKSIDEISKKQNFERYDIVLRGNDNPVALEIFNKFPYELSCGPTDIVSLSDKILIMARDRGHALTIEITIQNDKCFVTYFIPKICNAIMVNKLKGVKKVDENANFTVGMFETDINNISNEIIDFIRKVPMDEHMMIEGGLLYNSYMRW